MNTVSTLASPYFAGPYFASSSGHQLPNSLASVAQPISLHGLPTP